MKTKFYICLSVILCFVIADNAMLFLFPNVSVYSSYLLHIFNYAMISVVFTLVMVFLLSKLDTMKNGDGLDDERKAMFNQYSVFVIAFMISTVYYVCAYIFFNPNTELIKFWFWYKISE